MAGATKRKAEAEASSNRLLGLTRTKLCVQSAALTEGGSGHALGSLRPCSQGSKVRHEASLSVSPHQLASYAARRSGASRLVTPAASRARFAIGALLFPGAVAFAGARGSGPLPLPAEVQRVLHRTLRRGRLGQR